MKNLFYCLILLATTFAQAKDYIRTADCQDKENIGQSLTLNGDTNQGRICLYAIGVTPHGRVKQTIHQLDECFSDQQDVIDYLKTNFCATSPIIKLNSETCQQGYYPGQQKLISCTFQPQGQQADPGPQCQYDNDQKSCF